MDTYSQYFSIGALARKASVAVDTIRFYEREGLLPNPHRSASGYREYDDAAVERVRFIRRAKELGFTLEEIRDLLELKNDRDNGVEGVKRRANLRLAELNEQIQQLSATRDRLASLVEACPGEGAPESCPILSTMRGKDGEPAPDSCCSGEDKDGRQ